MKFIVCLVQDFGDNNGGSVFWRWECANTDAVLDLVKVLTNGERGPGGRYVHIEIVPWES